MKNDLLYGIVLLILSISTINAVQLYVVEYSPIRMKQQLIHDLVQENLQKINKAVAEIDGMGENAIVVYPEYALLHDEYINPKGEHCQYWSGLFNYIKNIYFKSPDVCPIASQLKKAKITAISCLAQARKIYIAANSLARNSKIHNVEFIFGPNSPQPISLYNKIHPVPLENAIIYAGDKSQLGHWKHGNTEAGTMICFDIIFEDSHRSAKTRKLFVFSTEWASSQELFSTAVQQGFSRVTNSILLAANINNPSDDFTQTGSGIYVAGRPAAVHIGPIQNSIKILEGNVDVTSPHANFFGDTVETLDPNCPRRAGGELSTEYRFLQVVGDFVPFSLNAGDLRCDFGFEGTKYGGDDVHYVARAQSGVVAGRVIRSCTLLAVKKADAAAAHYRKWKVYNHHIKHRFTKVVVSGNVHGSNVAILPLVTLMNADNMPTVVKRSEQSQFSYVDRATGKVSLSVRPESEGLAILSIYGVVDTAMPAQSPSDDLPGVGDARISQVAKEGEAEMQTCPAQKMSFLQYITYRRHHHRQQQQQRQQLKT